MALPYPNIAAAAAARTAIAVGAAANDGLGDPLRTAFLRSNARDAGLEQAVDQAAANFSSLDARTTSLEGSAQFLNWRGDWATATAYVYTPGVRRDVFRDAATGDVYMVLQSHTSTTLAADAGAGRIAESTIAQVVGDVSALGDAVAALELAVAEIPQTLAGYAALRAYVGSSAVISLTDLGVQGVFVHDPDDLVGVDNSGTLIVGADGRRWKRQWTGEVHACWFGTTAAALQAALTFAGTTGGTVVLPDAVYAVPTQTIDIPSNVILRGVGPQSEIRRTSNINAPLLRGLSVQNVTVRDLKLGTTAGFNSVTSNSVSLGSKSFTVPAGLDLVAGQDYMVGVGVSASAHNYMVGTVTSYSGTSLVINITSAVGSGTFSAWRFDRYDGQNCALQFSESSNCDAQGLVVDGRFYVGVVGQNSDVLLENSEFTGVVNRPVYVYAVSAGLADGSRISNNRIRGGGFTQYGINLNGSGGTIENVVITGNVIDQTQYQGIEVGGACVLVSVSHNQVDDVLSPSGVGILVQRANGVQPSRVSITGNTVASAGSAGIHVIDAFYTGIVNNQVTSCQTGIRVEQVSAGVGCQYTTVTANHANSCASAGLLFIGAVVNLCSFHVCAGNVAVACGIGFQSTANTDRIAFSANVAAANSTAYATAGTNHTTTGNI